MNTNIAKPTKFTNHPIFGFLFTLSAHFKSRSSFTAWYFEYSDNDLTDTDAFIILIIIEKSEWQKSVCDRAQNVGNVT